MSGDLGSESPGAPPGRPRRRADARRNVDAILAAARDLLGRGAMPSMNEVAAAAGVGRVTLYAHFSSREALLDAVVRAAIADTDRALADLGLQGDPPEAALRRLIRTSWPILDRHRTVRVVALAELGPEAVRDQHDPVVRHLDGLLERGQEAGVFRTDLPRSWLVAAFYATLHAAADEVGTGRLDSLAAPDVLVATVLSILGADGVGGSSAIARPSPSG